MTVFSVLASGNEFLRVVLLLATRLVESGDTGDDASDHEEKRNDGPDDSPALRGASISPGEDACIRAVYLAKNEIVTLLSAVVSNVYH